MNGTTFDTLAAAKALREAGFDQRQAEAAADVMRASQAGLATKADLAALEARLETKIERTLNRNLLAIMALNTILFAAMKFL